MYYSVFIKMKDSSDIKKLLNMENKEEVIEKVRTPFLMKEEFLFNDEMLKKETIDKILVVETAVKQLGNFDLVERFIRETQLYGEKFVNEKYPGFFVKDITEEIF